VFVYCEESKAAEIIFSLTGGREGKLMSYAPPVIITYPVSGVYLQHVLRNEITFETIENLGGVILRDRGEVPVYSVDIPTWQEDNAYGAGSKFIYRYSYTTPVRDGDDFKSKFVIEEWNKQTNLIRTIHRSRGLTPGEGAGRLAYIRPINKALLIEDMEGVLYSHEIPTGFTPTWQVNCIGCGAGECAGGNGKGGVICMDCKQMSADIQFIRNRLN
jgi:hypothetical protein